MNFRESHAQQAHQSSRQGERESYAPVPAACTAVNTQKPKPWWQRAGDWTADRVDKIGDALTGGWDAFNVRHLRFTRLEDGKISVRAETPPGTRLSYRVEMARAIASKKRNKG